MKTRKPFKRIPNYSEKLRRTKINAKCDDGILADIEILQMYDTALSTDLSACESDEVPVKAETVHGSAAGEDEAVQGILKLMDTRQDSDSPQISPQQGQPAAKQIPNIAYHYVHQQYMMACAQRYCQYVHSVWNNKQ